MSHHDAFTSSEAGKYSFIDDIFQENSGIKINSSPSVLNVTSCFFISCFNEYGGAILFLTKTNQVYISKTCGCFCYLTKESSYGVFIQLFDHQFLEYVSYFEVGKHYVSNINVSHNECEQRSFGYFKSQSLVIKNAISYNNSAKVEHMMNFNSNSSVDLLYNEIIRCKIEDHGPLFQAIGPTNFLYSQIIKCEAEQYFTGNFIFINCYADKDSMLNGIVYHQMDLIKNENHAFLNTFLCKGDEFNNPIKCFTPNKTNKNSLRFFSVIFLIYNSYIK